MNSSRRLGTSLVEVLVVIVVFLVGILAVVQVFPGGFKALSTTQKNTVATALGRAMIDILKNHADQLPDAIVPVKYTYNGGQIIIEKEPERFPNDLSPVYTNMDSTGTMFDSGGNGIGSWQFLTGANIVRRVIGEGKAIPAPRQVGAHYGGLLTLQFAPLVYNPTYSSIFVVYGNDLQKRAGDPTQGNFGPRPTEYWIDNDDNSNATLYLPRLNKNVEYRFEVSVFTNNAQSPRRDLVDVIVPVAAGAGWQAVPLNDPQYLGTDTLVAIEFDSVRVERVFEDLSPLAPGDWGPDPNDPYSYKLLSRQLGLVLFNPAGYNYFVRGPRGRRDPLIGRASYDVYDWRILHEEFRVPDVNPFQYRLAITGLKVTGEEGPDNTANQGIGVQAPDSGAALGNADVVLEDTETGALAMFKAGTSDPLQTSFTVNMSTGVITLLDYDSNSANGLQLNFLFPQAGSMVPMTVDGRSLRALYMGKSEWAVQVLKPAARYIETWGRPGIGEFYLGQSNAGNGLGDRIYFPPADAGRVVSLGEVYYQNTSGVIVGPLQLTAKIQSNNMDTSAGFTNRLPYIQMDQFYPDFAQFDYSYASAVKNVKGASVAVRVLWNPDIFRLSNDSNVNMDRLDKWMQSWRRSTVETYLQRGN